MIFVSTAPQSFAAEVKQVLVINSFGRNFSPFVNFAESFRSAITKDAKTPIDFYETSVFTERFEKRDDESSFVNYLRELFPHHNFDLIVTLGGPAARFIQQHRSNLFPETPLLITGVAEELVSTAALTPNDTVAATKIELKPFIENILRVRPQTQEIFIVLGNSRIENFWHSRLLRQFEPFLSRVRMTWWNNLSVDEISQRAAHLTSRSAVLYLVVYVDAAGVTYPTDSAFPIIRAAATAPVFGFGDYHFGQGIVGGPLRPTTDYGRQAGEVALRILEGEKPSNIATMAIGLASPVYDWRELQRWNISEDRLPAGSAVMYREPTVWTKYRWQIAGIVALVLLQAFLIAWLLYQRRQRQFAEATSRERMAMLAYMNRRAGAGELSASIAHEVKQPLAAIVSNADAALLWLTSKTPDLNEAVASLKDIINDGRRASDVIGTIRALYSKDEQDRAFYDINELVEEVLLLLHSELHESQVSVRKVTTPNMPGISVDKVQIQQVILNLLVNANDALKQVTDRSREIHIRTEVDVSGDILLSVKDSGPGIDPQGLEHIFQPFYTTKPKGLGLGLAICRSIVEAHDGQLTAMPGKNHGMFFRMALPAADAGRVEDADRQRAQA
jgi:signal transduction histidine kinase